MQIDPFSSPAQRVIKRFGGARRLAVLLDLAHASTVYRWTYSRERNGTNGNIPFKYHRPSLIAAEKLKIPLEKTDLI